MLLCALVSVFSADAVEIIAPTAAEADLGKEVYSVPVSKHTVCSLDGQKYVNDCIIIGNGVVSIFGTATGANTPVEIPIARCDWIDLSSSRPDAPLPFSKSQKGVLLKDGSWLPAMDIRSALGDDTLIVTSSLGSFQFSVLDIIGWGQYEDIAEKAGAKGEQNDCIWRTTGPSVEGSIVAVRDNSVFIQTNLLPEPIPLSFDTIRSVCLRGEIQVPTGVHFRMTTQADAPPLCLAPVYPLCIAALYSSSVPDTEMKGALEPVADLPRLFVVGGDRVYLSDMTPSLVETEGAFGATWAYGVDKQIDGSQIRLNATSYEKGLVIHSKSLLEWSLNGQYETFTATIGIADDFHYEGNCAVSLIADEQVVWHKQQLRGVDGIQRVHLPVDDVRTFTIQVDYGERFDIGDHCVFAEAHLVRVQK